MLRKQYYHRDIFFGWMDLIYDNINKSKANDIMDLKSMDDTAWQFISILYKSGWDFLVTNNNNRIFR